MNPSIGKKPKAKRVVEGETRQDKFVRLAKSRSEKFLDFFVLLQNLVDGYAYQVEPKLAKELLARFEKEFANISTVWRAAIEKAEAKAQQQKGDISEKGGQETPALPIN